MIKELQKILNSEIPITNAIGICIEKYADNGIKISAPLENNINHKSTAFGGSLYSISVLAGWALLFAFLKESNRQGHIVIHESSIRFLKPVKGKIIASCQLGDETTLNRFLKTFDRKGMARIKLISTIPQGGEDAVIFEGTYVVHK